LPERISRNLLENVDVWWKISERAQNRKATGRATLLGLYEGVP